MNVLSVFDGMSCGRVALERAGIPIKNYFASEVDKYAIQVAKKNYPDTHHIGDVQNVSTLENHLYINNGDGYETYKIDLLIGGSPCQGFSFAGKQLNFDDERSKLFFEFVRLLKELKPKYFLLENVRMKKEYQDIITEYLGVEPIKINSSLVSAQNRVRLYWTNIPNVTQPDDRGIVLKDILEQEPGNFVKMSNTFTSRLKGNRCLTDMTQKKASNLSAMEYVKNGRQGDYIACSDAGKPIQSGHREPKISYNETHYRKLTPIECERLQTVPDNYTDGVSNTQRYKMLGNGWTVDVIAHIFRGIY